MQKALAWGRNVLALVGVLAVGLWLGSTPTVKAASYQPRGDVQFQLAGVNERSSLLVYQPGSKTLYVYQGATTGNSKVQCSFIFQIGRPGSAIHRENCAPGQLTP